MVWEEGEVLCGNVQSPWDTLIKHNQITLEELFILIVSA